MNLKDLGYLGKEIELYGAMLESLNEMTDDKLYKAELAAAIESIRLKCWLKLRELLDFVNAIPDSTIQDLVIWRYAERRTWQHIANTMGFGSKSVWRLSCKRYLEKYLPQYIAEKEQAEKSAG